ncbi:serine hydrolase [Phormidium sp. CLA17]|uniref:serine hydrolase n=1 Tax=Leptolyngbya sp. Cla-17 TaxID=2803751 RepID=UPI0014918F9C|nr:serine hydrolase [Leptolyngbya sp. Cla-17]MBM0743786.1 serine hydrolase [Leptolyngbya sp. Cla-17]
MHLDFKLPWVLSSLAGFLLVFPSSVQANSLQSWRFDARQNRLEFSTDEGVQPTAQLVANPTRLVIDLPGTKLKRPKISESFSGTVQNLRIGQFDAQTTRLVIELAPGYVLDPAQVKVRGQSPTQWSVQLPTPRLDVASPVVIPAQTTGASQWAGATIPKPTVMGTVPGRKISPAIAATPPAIDLNGLMPAGRSLNWLQQRLASLRSGEYASLKPGMFFMDLETGNYAEVNGDKVYPTASIIKLPILIALFQAVDAGTISLNETLTMTRDVIVGGSGEIQDLPPGSKFSLLDTATKMIVTSDNTATNMIIKRMGGIQVLNARFRSWGLQKTVMRNMLPDLKGTNTTTARELVQLLTLLDKQQLLSSRSQSQALDILQRVRNRTLLPVGLGRGATIAHKTGDIGFILGDAGIIQMPTGKRYLAAVLVESAYDDPGARDFIQDVSRIVYTYLSQPGSAAFLP